MRQNPPSSKLTAAPGANHRASRISRATAERGAERSRLERSQTNPPPPAWCGLQGNLNVSSSGFPAVAHCVGIKIGPPCRRNHSAPISVFVPGIAVAVPMMIRSRDGALQALITGDMILGCGSAIFDDFESYMASLRRVLAISSAQDGGFTR